MKKNILFVTVLISAVIFSILPLFFRVNPSAQLWKSYKTIFIRTSDFEQKEKESSIFSENFKQLNNKYKILYKDFSDSITKKTSVYVPDKEGVYLIHSPDADKLENFFFRDRSKKWILLYVPEGYYRDYIKEISLLDIPFGSDAAAKFPYASFFVTVIFAVILIIIGKISLKHVVCIIPLIIFSFSCLYYICSAAVMFILLSFFTAETCWKRKKALKVLFKTPTFYVFFALGIILPFFSNIRNAMLFLCSLTAVFLITGIFMQIELALEKNYFFFFKRMLPATLIKSSSRLNKTTLLTADICYIVMLLFFILSSGFVRMVGIYDLDLPAPDRFTVTKGFSEVSLTEIKRLRSDKSQTDILDFFNNSWINCASPYVKNGSKLTLEPGEKVFYPQFAEKDGKIFLLNDVIMQYDDDFIEKCVSDFSNGKSAVKLLVAQKNPCTISYMRLKSSEVNSKSFILLFIVTLVLLFYTVIVCIQARKGKSK